MAWSGSHAHRWAPIAVAGTAVVVGLMLVGCALLALHADHSTPTAFGSLSAASMSDPPFPSTASGTFDSSVPASAYPTWSSQARMPVLTRPVTLRVPALRVTAPVERVVTNDGLLGVPEDIAHVGWWIGSSLPGSHVGTVVIAGHVDSAADGEGALFHLTALQPGQNITLINRGGYEVTYQVYARRIYNKANALPASLFASTGPARLVIITCGGRFDAVERSYLDNVAVFARPAASTRSSVPPVNP